MNHPKITQTQRVELDRCPFIILFLLLAVAAWSLGEIKIVWPIGGGLVPSGPVLINEQDVRTIQFFIREEGTSASLSGITTRFRVMPLTTTTLTIDATATASATRTGLAYYKFLQGDFTAGGVYLGQLSITDGDSTVSSPLLRIVVEPAVGSADSAEEFVE